MATKKLSGGLYFSRGLRETTKRHAKSTAVFFRKQGNKARVLREGKGWTTFVRSK